MEFRILDATVETQVGPSRVYTVNNRLHMAALGVEVTVTFDNPFEARALAEVAKGGDVDEHPARRLDYRLWLANLAGDGCQSWDHINMLEGMACHRLYAEKFDIND